MKKTVMNFTLMLIGVCAFAQTPDWQWAIQAGGSEYDSANAIAIDENGNSFVSGEFEGTATFGSYSLSSNGYWDIFVAKLDADGNWLWVAQAGGNDLDSANAIAIDENGNSYVTGRFSETATFGSYSLTSNGYCDIFVAKLDADGNWLWVAQAGGNDLDFGTGIAIDENSNSYVTGVFEGTATFGSYSLTGNSIRDIFVAKLDANGNWQWAVQAGGIFEDYGYAIALDENGNSYVTGGFEETATFGSYSLSSSGDWDIYIAKLDANGNWQWTVQAGGNNFDVSTGIAIDENGNSYVTGFFEGTAIFGSYSLTGYGNSRDMFVAKMDADGNWLWATQAGGFGFDSGSAISIDNYGSSYVTGRFSETATFGSYSLTSNGYWDIFVAKMDVNGNWVWAVQAGGSYTDKGHGIAIDENGNSYVSGRFRNTATFGSHYLTGGYDDIFVAKLEFDTSVENEFTPLHSEFSNYPNPFNPTTTISFSIPNDSNIILSIYNIKGQIINTLVHDEIIKGSHSVIWSGVDEASKSVGSGIYYYKLIVNGKTEAVKKCLLLK